MSRKAYFSPSEIKEFKEKGFVIVRNLFSELEMREVKKNANELLNEEPEFGKQMVYLEENLMNPGKKQVSRIENFFPFNATLKKLCNDERMMVRVEELFGEPGVLFKDKINYKLPGEGEVTPHQDIQSNWSDFADFFISVQICIDENTIQNGCLEICSGFHKNGLIGTYWEPLSEEVIKDMDFIDFTANPGDCIFFDCFTPHRSKPNMSDETRSNIYLTYNPLSKGDHRELYFSGKRRDFPPDNERKPGQNLKFQV